MKYINNYNDFLFENNVSKADRIFNKLYLLKKDDFNIKYFKQYYNTIKEYLIINNEIGYLELYAKIVFTFTNITDIISVHKNIIKKLSEYWKTPFCKDLKDIGIIPVDNFMNCDTYEDLEDMIISFRFYNKSYELKKNLYSHLKKEIDNNIKLKDSFYELGKELSDSQEKEFLKKIARFKNSSLEEFMKYLENFVNGMVTEPSEEIIKRINSTNSKIVYNENNIIVVKIFDEKDSIELGSDTAWCISTKTNNYFKEYQKRDLVNGLMNVTYFLWDLNRKPSDNYYRFACTIKGNGDYLTGHIKNDEKVSSYYKVMTEYRFSEEQYKSIFKPLTFEEVEKIVKTNPPEYSFFQHILDIRQFLIDGIIKDEENKDFYLAVKNNLFNLKKDLPYREWINKEGKKIFRLYRDITIHLDSVVYDKLRSESSLEHTELNDVITFIVNILYDLKTEYIIPHGGL